MGWFADAERLYIRSWELSQNSALAIRARARNYLQWTGDVSGALKIIATIPESLRDHPLHHLHRAWMLALRGEIEPAINAYEQVRSNVTRSNSGLRGNKILATYRIGQLEARLGHGTRATELYAEALTAALQYSKDFPDLGTSRLAVIRALRGEKSEALSAINEAMRLAAGTHGAAQIAGVRRGKAIMLAVLGETDAAIAELRALHELGLGFGYTLRLDLDWEPLRGDAKFQQLMKDAEARAEAQPRPKK